MPDENDASRECSGQRPPDPQARQRAARAETPWDEVRLREALVAQEPTATRLLVEDYSLPLLRILRQKYALLPEADVRSAAHDALMAVIGSPAKFDPSRGSLLNYVVHIGTRRCIDQIRAETRRPLIVLEESVEDWAGPANNEIGMEMDGPPGEEFDVNNLPSEMRGAILAALPDSRDQALLALMCERERSTAAAAGVLGISHLPVEEQQREVKRAKDRIRVSLRRLGLFSGETDETG